MGLDQYLFAKKYLSSTGFLGEDNKEKYNAIVDIIDANDIVSDVLPAIFVDVKIGYWRKANHIHQWFVDNVQDGEDDCRDAYVSIEKLDELYADCEKVLADNSLAEELLPTCSGFFFGSTEYDEFYFDDIRQTMKIIEKARSIAEDYSFFYASSW